MKDSSVICFNTLAVWLKCENIAFESSLQSRKCRTYCCVFDITHKGLSCFQIFIFRAYLFKMGNASKYLRAADLLLPKIGQYNLKEYLLFWDTQMSRFCIKAFLVPDPCDSDKWFNLCKQLSMPLLWFSSLIPRAMQRWNNFLGLMHTVFLPALTRIQWTPAAGFTGGCGKLHPHGVTTCS